MLNIGLFVALRMRWNKEFKGKKRLGVTDRRRLVLGVHWLQNLWFSWKKGFPWAAIFPRASHRVPHPNQIEPSNLLALFGSCLWAYSTGSAQSKPKLLEGCVSWCFRNLQGASLSFTHFITSYCILQKPIPIFFSKRIASSSLFGILVLARKLSISRLLIVSRWLGVALAIM